MILHIAPNGMSDKLQNGEQKIVSLSRFMSFLSPPLLPPLPRLSVPSSTSPHPPLENFYNIFLEMLLDGPLLLSVMV